MTAKELKEIINQIPDDKKIIFEYSCFTFNNIGKIEYDKRKMPSMIDAYRDDFNCKYPGKGYCMISFNN